MLCYCTSLRSRHALGGAKPLTREASALTPKGLHVRAGAEKGLGVGKFIKGAYQRSLAKPITFGLLVSTSTYVQVQPTCYKAKPRRGLAPPSACLLRREVQRRALTPSTPSTYVLTVRWQSQCLAKGEKPSQSQSEVQKQKSKQRPDDAYEKLIKFFFLKKKF